MKKESYQAAFSVTLVVVMVAFLAAVFFTNANLSYAAGSQKKSSGAVRTSAVAYTETQIKQLQGALNITEAQKDLWNSFTRVMRENAKDMDAFTDTLGKERAEGTKTMNSVERMKFHSRITKAHLEQMEKLIPPFEAFYSSMSDEQKNMTDTIFRTGKHGKQRRK